MITNSFKHCGFQSAGKELTDPFADMDDQDVELDGGLDGLVRQHDADLTTTDNVNCDEDVPTCATFEKKSDWREELCDMVLSLGSCSKKLALMESVLEDEEGESEEEPNSKITTFRGAINLGNNMIRFLTEKGEEDLSQDTFEVVQQMEYVKLQHSKEMSIVSYTSYEHV